jgi:phosphate transport system substrate-binding protein
MELKKQMIRKSLLAATALIAMTGMAEARDQIRIVGSSTVYPFSTAVAETFGRTTSFRAPIVESTGSGGGLKLFCAGAGDEHPDITNASRRIKKSEVENCAKNGIKEILEVKVGYDGIVIANSRASEKLTLTRQQIFLALAKDVPAGEGKTQPNPYKTWKDVDASLPNVKIEVLGPPPTSGTRDAFTELALEEGCKSIGWIKAMEKSDKKAFTAICHTVREDGAYIEAGENDNLIVSKLEANPKAFGVFGYSFLDQNSDKLQGSVVEGHSPTFEEIASGAYPVSRPLYFYVKKSQIGKVPGLQEYTNEFASDKASGPDGYLADKGLIPLGDAERADRANAVKTLANLVM